MPRGQILLLALIYFGIFFSVVTALAGYLLVYVKSEQYAVAGAKALAIAEGGVDKAVYELNENPGYTGETNTALGDGAFTAVVTNIDTNTRLVTVTASVPASAPLAIRTVKARVALTSAVVSFRYGMQAGEGGITMANSSSINGNVFSGGPVVGDGGNMVRGSIVSAGENGQVYGVHATSSVYAHTIGSASKPTQIDGDAYYATTLTNTTLNGTAYPGSVDLPDAEFPISDEQVDAWKADAEAGTLVDTCDASGNYVIDGASVSLGPHKILCNLVISKNSTVVTINGPVWVVGNITTQNGPMIALGNLGGQNVPIIADKPSDPNGSGIISVNQATGFSNTNSPGSFVFLVSQNRSAENGGTTAAISLSQGASALVAYAAHGLIAMNQSVSVKEATGYKISLAQSASVTYETGLGSSVFQAGPGGSFQVIAGTYSVTQF